MALIRITLTLRSVAILAAMFAIATAAACSDLDPVKVESKCEGTGVIDQNCPQCQTPRIASNCQQCQQSAPDGVDCLPPDEPWTLENSESDASTLPDGGTSTSEDRQASPDSSSGPGEPSSGNAGPGNPAKPGKDGSSGAQPGSGSGGKGGSESGDSSMASAGRRPPTAGSTVCVTDSNCTEPGYPGCRGDGTCVECVRDTNCPSAMQCDKAANRCVECVTDDFCAAQGKVCFKEGRVCVQCNNSGQCPSQTPACTLEHECVACTAEQNLCPVETPSCFENKCVECSVDPDCTRNGTHACVKDEHHCVECKNDSHCRGVSGRTHCDTSSSACVGCLEDADCSDPSAAHCDPYSHSCVGCSSATQCAAFAARTPQCDAKAGKCVACDRDGGICNGKACILSSHVCSDKNRQSVAACAECASSDECIAGHVCVPTMFGSRSTGNRCLPNYKDYQQVGKPCPRPYSRKIPNVDTVEDFHVDSLCALPDNTSCAALQDTLRSKDCMGNNLNCGLAMYDGICGMEGGTYFCTYNCTSSDLCPNAMTCSDAMRICL